MSILITALIVKLSNIFMYTSIEASEPSSSLTKSFDRLFMVSHIVRDSTVRSKICTDLDRSEKYNNCAEITFTKKGYTAVIPCKAQLLANEKVVVSIVWKKVTASSDKTATGFVTFYLIDLNSLYSQPVAFQGPFDNGTLNTYNPFEIIPYENNFDVFVKSRKYCSPPGSYCLVR